MEEVTQPIEHPGTSQGRTHSREGFGDPQLGGGFVAGSRLQKELASLQAR